MPFEPSSPTVPSPSIDSSTRDQDGVTESTPIAPTTQRARAPPPPPPRTMAAQVSVSSSPAQSPHLASPATRLPPIFPDNSSAASPATYSATSQTFPNFMTYPPAPPSSSGRTSMSSPTTSRPPFLSGHPSPVGSYQPRQSTMPVSPLSTTHSGSHVGQKRSREAMIAGSSERSIPTHTIPPMVRDTREPMSRILPPPLNTRNSYSSPPISAAAGGASTPFSPPMGMTHHHAGPFPPQPSHASTPPLPPSNSHRCILHLRQQPRAARAGPDGKDRRVIDPPPVLQLLMQDFDPNSPADMAELRSTFFVVHCRLISAGSPRSDLSTVSSITEDGSKEVQRLLLGTAVSSPLTCQDDPDPPTMPDHPSSTLSSGSKSHNDDPPSPTSRFIHASSTRPAELAQPTSSTTWPATFFIFADLSVRKAGDYRLQFSLMKMEAAIMMPGSKVPILHSVTSDVFKVVNAKDFDQVQPSTSLVKGLLDRGAGFPLKLKKGTREGARRRTQEADDASDDEDDD